MTAPGVVVEAGFGLDTLVEFRWQATLHGELLSEEEIDQLAEAKRGLVRLRGRWVAADPALLERAESRAVGSGSRRPRRSVTLLAGTVDLDGEAVRCRRRGATGGAGRPPRRYHRRTGGRARRAPPVSAIDVELRPYQSRGVTWLHAMADAGLGGCLADDMGLGKTLQVIALHLHRAAASRGPTLVICPTSLLGNWEREVRRFAPGSRRSGAHHGPSRSLEDLAPGEVVVTSYGVARRGRRERSAAAGFSLVVADEAQHAKNP